MNDKLTVRILSPKELIYQGEANSVSSKNLAGKFDILPYHANMVTFVENQNIVIRTVDEGGPSPSGNKKQAFKFPFAIIYNHNNRVDIYTQINIAKL